MKNRLLWWPVIIAFGVPVMLIACKASPIGPDFLYVLVGIPSLIIFWAMSAFVALLMALRRAWARAWRAALSMACLPAIVLPALYYPDVMFQKVNWTADVIHFRLTRAHYLSVVRHLPDTGAPKLIVFSWGGMLWASSGVVYDEADEAALPPEKRSAAWTDRARHTELACSGANIAPVGGHFYIADFDC